MSFVTSQSPRSINNNKNYVDSSPTPSVASSHSSPWIRKPLSVVRQQESSISLHTQGQINNNNNGTTTNTTNNNNNNLHRHLSVWDLIGIGVGGTIGSGIFVLTGQIAAQYSGKACWLSLLLAGLAACLSGNCYAELSARIPAAGSTYVYAYVCLGELAAVMAAACLTLEYGVAGAAVARTWGDKVVMWLQYHFNDMNTVWLQPTNNINIPAFFVSAISTALLLSGVQESKRVMNGITIFKMLIVTFMIIGGFMLYRSDINDPFAPYGTSGVLRGATTSFFGYLGYDEVCCVAGEAKHPARDMPRAVLGTLITVTICYILAAIALTGMLSYTEISPTAGFPDAFRTRGWEVAAQITAAGEVLTLPVVVLISLMAQPRLTLSMAVDGLLPKIFAQVNEEGNLQGGTLVSGVIMTIIATFVPFTYLDDLISAGILVAFSMTNACLVLLRCESPIHKDGYLEKLLACYNILCFLAAMLWNHEWSYVPFQMGWASLVTLVAVLCVIEMARSCPKTMHFGGCILREGEYSSERHINHDESSSENEDFGASSEDDYFQTPAIPYLPCLGIAVNWYLVAQLEGSGILLLLLYLGITAIIYGFGCAPNSVGHIHNWNNVRGEYDVVDNNLTSGSQGFASRRSGPTDYCDNPEEDDHDEFDEVSNKYGLIPPKSKIPRTNSF